MADIPAVQVNNLNFAYKSSPVLRNISFTLPKGSRCLLVGPNGAGKSTLLRILAGKHMHKHGEVLVLGQHAFYSTPRTLTHLGSEWRKSVSFAAVGVTVKEMLRAHEKTIDKERVAMLIKLLEIDLDWCTNQTSDGELRRIQILLGLSQKFDLLLLDEITVDLDCYMRTQLLEFLRSESMAGATIVYATHIFDGLEEWPSTICRLSDGDLIVYPPTVIEAKVGRLVSPLYLTCVEWIKEDLEKMRKRQALENGTSKQQ
eukprot:TRINITY_DN9019_c0_g1_i1.p1 TRINITY_DN9019_c0_g1~~TRINITY_DN9019_c0_g1_i1.p1  ORF type:complete len:283 (+),score=75.34 TRINITY_DN9019_c0_g1_i1:76-849(+)